MEVETHCSALNIDVARGHTESDKENNIQVVECSKITNDETMLESYPKSSIENKEEEIKIVECSKNTNDDTIIENFLASSIENKEKEVQIVECSKIKNDDSILENDTKSCIENKDALTVQDYVIHDTSENTLEYSAFKPELSNNNQQSDKLIIKESEMVTQTTQDPINSDNSESRSIITHTSLVFENIQMLTGAWTEFNPKKGQFGELPVFLKGCKWSPDGTCLLTNSEDATLRLFDLPLQLYNCQCLPQITFPELRPSLKTKIGGQVYDYCWYPLMSSLNAATCCFLTTSSNSPVQLWDAFSGSLRCSYRGYNLQDELHAALSVGFHPSGDLIYCGYKDSVNIFHTDIPGRDYTVLSTKELCEQKGLVSCIAVNPSMLNIFAAGTYTKSVGLYSTDGHGICLLEGQAGGVTQVMFTADGSRLFSSGRKDSEILCWDLRQLGGVLAVMKRPHTTNQRVYMDLSTDNHFLLSGSTEGHVYVWDLDSVPEDTVLQPLTQWRAHNDCANGVRHIPVIATASGQRHVPDIIERDDDDDLVFSTQRPKDKCEESVKLWWAGNIKGIEESEEMRDTNT